MITFPVAPTASYGLTPSNGNILDDIYAECLKIVQYEDIKYIQSLIKLPENELPFIDYVSLPLNLNNIYYDLSSIEIKLGEVSIVSIPHIQSTFTPSL